MKTRKNAISTPFSILTFDDDNGVNLIVKKWHLVEIEVFTQALKSCPDGLRSGFATTSYALAVVAPPPEVEEPGFSIFPAPVTRISSGKKLLPSESSHAVNSFGWPFSTARIK